jgi:26S proteasome regulatory subunit N10
MNDPEFLQRVLSSLPGVDPNSDAVRSAFENLNKDSASSSKDKGKDNNNKDKEDKK